LSARFHLNGCVPTPWASPQPWATSLCGSRASPHPISWIQSRSIWAPNTVISGRRRAASHGESSPEPKVLISEPRAYHVFASAWVFNDLPEVKNRTLEEIDEMV